jgi:chromosome segregation ATPase
LEKARANVDKERNVLRRSGSGDLVDDDTQTSTVISEAIERLKRKHQDAQRAVDEATTQINFLQDKKDRLSSLEKKILQFNNSHHEIAAAKARQAELDKNIESVRSNLETLEAEERKTKAHGTTFDFISKHRT